MSFQPQRSSRAAAARVLCCCAVTLLAGNGVFAAKWEQHHHVPVGGGRDTALIDAPEPAVDHVERGDHSDTVTVHAWDPSMAASPFLKSQMDLDDSLSDVDIGPSAGSGDVHRSGQLVYVHTPLGARPREVRFVISLLPLIAEQLSPIIANVHDAEQVDLRSSTAQQLFEQVFSYVYTEVERQAENNKWGLAAFDREKSKAKVVAGIDAVANYLGLEQLRYVLLRVRGAMKLMDADPFDGADDVPAGLRTIPAELLPPAPSATDHVHDPPPLSSHAGAKQILTQLAARWIFSEFFPQFLEESRTHFRELLPSRCGYLETVKGWLKQIRRELQDTVVRGEWQRKAARPTEVDLKLGLFQLETAARRGERSESRPLQTCFGGPEDEHQQTGPPQKYSLDSSMGSSTTDCPPSADVGPQRASPSADHFLSRGEVVRSGGHSTPAIWDRLPAVDAIIDEEEDEVSPEPAHDPLPVPRQQFASILRRFASTLPAGNGVKAPAVSSSHAEAEKLLADVDAAGELLAEYAYPALEHAAAFYGLAELASDAILLRIRRANDPGESEVLAGLEKIATLFEELRNRSFGGSVAKGGRWCQVKSRHSCSTATEDINGGLVKRRLEKYKHPVLREAHHISMAMRGAEDVGRRLASLNKHITNWRIDSQTARQLYELSTAYRENLARDSTSRSSSL